MRRWSAALLVLGGCTTNNPLFGEGVDGGGSEGPGTSSLDGTRGSSSGETRGTSSETSEGGSEVGSETAVSFTDASSETGDACTVPEGVEVALFIGPIADTDPTCASVWQSPLGPLVVVDGTVGVVDCDCECADRLVPSVTATVEGVELPGLPECGHMIAWQREGDRGCEWAGLAVFGADDHPEWIVSRSQLVPTEVSGGLATDLNPAEPCRSLECRKAGAYELEFLGAEGDNKITMDEGEKAMKLPFAEPTPYIVDDVSSVIDESCVTQLAWTATYDP